MILVLIGWYYRFHLMWLYAANHLGLASVQAVPDRPMPETPIPKDWVRCSLGRIEFSLPTELAKNKVPQKEGITVSAFRHGSRVVLVGSPSDSSDISGLLKAATHLSPQSESFTLPKLRLACYQASSNDFRWSMTPKQAGWHAFRITTSSMLRLMPGGHTESLLRKDLDAVVHFDDERAALDWQSDECKLGGYMHFMERDGKINPDWVRAICQSLKVLKEAEPERRQPP
jgi:hypothetical protein